MIATLEEVKALLGITGTEQDAQITALMSAVQSEIIRYTKNSFASDSPLQNFTSDTIYFSSSDNKIKDDSGGIVDNSKLTGSENIVVTYSLMNNKHFTVKSISDTEIEVDEVVIEESNIDNINIVIRTVLFPEDLKATFTSMINSKLNPTSIGNGVVSSKKLEGFQVDFDTGGSGSDAKIKNGFLMSDYKALDKYKKAYRD